MNFKTIKFPGEKTEYIAPTWEEMNQLAFAIAQKIIKDNRKFDRIVTLAKGGWPMTRSMVDFLSVGKVASIGVKFYSGIYQRLDQPQIYQDIPEPIKGENVLLFDDVADSGGSLVFVQENLEKKGAKTITTATLFYKPWSVFKPDYFAAQTSAWIVFPYEVSETIKILSQKWPKLSQEEITGRFVSLGLKPEWIDFYLTAS